MLGQIIVNGLISGSIYVLVTVGFALTYSVGRFFDMSYGAHVLLGAYAGFFAYQRLHLDPVLVILISALLAGLQGVLTERSIFRALKGRKAPPLVFFVTTLGMLITAQALVMLIFGSDIKVMHPGPYPSLSFCGLHFTSVQVAICLLSPTLLITAYLVIYKTDLGRRIRSISDDEQLSAVVGIPVEKILPYIFFSGAFLAGIAGVIAGFEMPLEPSLGLRAVLWAVVASIIGGIGSLPGAVLGAYALGLLESISVWLLPSEWKAVLVFAMLIIFLCFRPNGILGVTAEKYSQ